MLNVIAKGFSISALHERPDRIVSCCFVPIEKRRAPAPAMAKEQE